MKRKNNIKKGMTAITTPLVLAVSVVIITTIAIFAINLITPFIKYQKLDAIAAKYMFIAEKFGYLTDVEYKSLLYDLEKEKFDKANISIECPMSKLPYGTYFRFRIRYNYSLKFPLILKEYEKEIPLDITKHAFSKN